MTELQPTEVELTGRKKKKPASMSKRKIAAIVSITLLVAALAVLTVFLAHRASATPDLVQPGALPAEQVQK
ncbi:MAG TPA: hypothetical protein PKH40_08360 [Treponemataceae bacterium]|jgi:hypothetical protein|nr:MAG: hypothetical protein BWY39_01559 [Spirochaetes bacterium ADurb.Bin269]TAH55028.1 MAG: hypothetical protein EWM51_04275 [Treponema sp.]HOC29680.1 hypothetical protein [Treponemataceae bacterium]HPX46937.1 hypothetical protein [Treponemataceae bacterium]HQL33455.1 hypothetical protein [Treponemataceae bacterium]